MPGVTGFVEVRPTEAQLNALNKSYLNDADLKPEKSNRGFTFKDAKMIGDRERKNKSLMFEIKEIPGQRLEPVSQLQSFDLNKSGLAYDSGSLPDAVHDPV